MMMMLRRVTLKEGEVDEIRTKKATFIEMGKCWGQEKHAQSAQDNQSLPPRLLVMLLFFFI